MAPRYLAGAMGMAALLALTAHSLAQPGAEPPPVQTYPATVDPWRDLPGRLTLRGLVTDTAGKPIAGVAIGTADGPLTRSDREGRFALPGPLAPDTPLAFSHPDHADLRRAAGFFHAGEGRDTRVELVPLALSFALTPAGGRVLRRRHPPVGAGGRRGGGGDGARRAPAPGSRLRGFPGYPAAAPGGGGVCPGGAALRQARHRQCGAGPGEPLRKRAGIAAGPRQRPVCAGRGGRGDPRRRPRGVPGGSLQPPRCG